MWPDDTTFKEIRGTRKIDDEWEFWGYTRSLRINS